MSRTRKLEIHHLGAAAPGVVAVHFDLGVDLVLPASVLEARHGVALPELEAAGYTIIHRLVARSTAAPGSERWRPFVATSPWYHRLSGHQLRHLAGVAALRAAIGYPAYHHAWISNAHGRHADADPDGLWYSGRGCHAIEYDAGAYNRAKLGAKFEAFASGCPENSITPYAGQLWGAPSPERVETVAGIARLAVAQAPRGSRLAALEVVEVPDAALLGPAAHNALAGRPEVVIVCAPWA